MSPRKRPKQELTKGIPNPNFRPSKKDNMEGIQVLMVLIFFFSCFTVLYHFFKMDLSIYELIKFYSLFLGISFLIPISLYRKKLTMSIYEYLFINFLAFSPMFLGGTFYLNSQFKHAKYKETYRIINTDVSELSISYTLEGNAYEDRKFLRSINDKDNVVVKGKNYLTIYFSDGLFGIRIIESKELH